MPHSRLYVCYHDDYSHGYSLLHYGGISCAKMHKIPTTQYFESKMFIDELSKMEGEWQDADYVGTITWKAKQKIQLPNIEQTLSRAKEDGASLLAFYQPSCPLQKDIVAWAQRQHVHFARLWEVFCTQLGYIPEQYLSKDIPAFYCNYWMTTPSLMKEYIAHAQKAYAILENYDDGTFQTLLHSDSKFEYKVPRPGISYITYHCFLMERLPCLFFWAKGILPYTI